MNNHEEESKNSKEELLKSLKKFDKSYTRTIIMETIFFAILLIFLLFFLFT